MAATLMIRFCLTHPWHLAIHNRMMTAVLRKTPGRTEATILRTMTPLQVLQAIRFLKIRVQKTAQKAKTSKKAACNNFRERHLRAGPPSRLHRLRVRARQAQILPGQSSHKAF